jgi:hypothetical protein
MSGEALGDSEAGAVSVGTGVTNVCWASGFFEPPLQAAAISSALADNTASDSFAERAIFEWAGMPYLRHIRLSLLNHMG